MKVAGSDIFEAPQRTVSKALQNPTVVSSVLPGRERLNEVGEKTWEGELDIRVGPPWIGAHGVSMVAALPSRLVKLESFPEASRGA